MDSTLRLGPNETFPVVTQGLLAVCKGGQAKGADYNYGIRSNHMIKTKRTANEEKPANKSASTNDSLKACCSSKSITGDIKKPNKCCFLDSAQRNEKPEHNLRNQWNFHSLPTIAFKENKFVHNIHAANAWQVTPNPIQDWVEQIQTPMQESRKHCPAAKRNRAQSSESEQRRREYRTATWSQTVERKFSYFLGNSKSNLIKAYSISATL